MDESRPHLDPEFWRWDGNHIRSQEDRSRLYMRVDDVQHREGYPLYLRISLRTAPTPAHPYYALQPLPDLSVTLTKVDSRDINGFNRRGRDRDRELTSARNRQLEVQYAALQAAYQSRQQAASPSPEPEFSHLTPEYHEQASYQEQQQASSASGGYQEELYAATPPQRHAALPAATISTPSWAPQSPPAYPAHSQFGQRAVLSPSWEGPPSPSEYPVSLQQAAEPAQPSSGRRMRPLPYDPVWDRAREEEPRSDPYSQTLQRREGHPYQPGESSEQGSSPRRRRRHHQHRAH
jgi:hypothetical protein